MAEYSNDIQPQPSPRDQSVAWELHNIDDVICTDSTVEEKVNILHLMLSFITIFLTPISASDGINFIISVILSSREMLDWCLHIITEMRDTDTERCSGQK